MARGKASSSEIVTLTGILTLKTSLMKTKEDVMTSDDTEAHTMKPADFRRRWVVPTVDPMPAEPAVTMPSFWVFTLGSTVENVFI